MNIPQSVRGGSSGPASSELGDQYGDREARLPASAPSRVWRTQDRISRCRGLGYCVIEVHEFDPERPQARPTIEYRVYHEAHGFPVGDAIGSFATQKAAQRRAEMLGARSPREED